MRCVEVNPHDHHNPCLIHIACLQIAPWIVHGMVPCHANMVNYLNSGQWHALAAWDGSVHVLLQVRIQVFKNEVQDRLIMYVDMLDGE